MEAPTVEPTESKKEEEAVTATPAVEPKQFEYRYARMPSGSGDKLFRRHQRSPCTQWPWATKNKSNIPFGPGGNGDGLQVDEIRSTVSPKKHVQYPWSHQHKSEALDFVGNNPDMRNWRKNAKSMYKSDFVPTTPPSNSRTAGKPSLRSLRSLSGTNIRNTTTRSKTAPKESTPQQQQELQRWTSKVVEPKRRHGDKEKSKDAEDEEKERKELEEIGQLNLDEAITKLQTEGTGKQQGTTNPFYHVSQKTK